MKLALRALAAVAVVAAGLLMFVPMRATYLGVVPHDGPLLFLPVEARCGAPVMALLGTEDPILPPETDARPPVRPATPDSARVACGVAAGERVSASLLLLTGVALASARRGPSVGVGSVSAMTLGLRALAVAVAVAAGLVMLVPLEASYRGSRSVEYHPAPFRLTHEARCGAPVMSLLGTDPVVAADSYSAYPNAAALACHAPAWKRVNTGLLLLGLLAGGAAVTAHGARRFGADDALTSSTPA